MTTIAILTTSWYGDILAALERGARRYLTSQLSSDTTIPTIQVAGACELPLMAKWLAATKKYRALIALGCVIRGRTSHYEHVCRTLTFGLLRVQLDYGIPIGNGVLTLTERDQAAARCAEDERNHGYQAAAAAYQQLANQQRWCGEA